jgi:hypothetical protein
MPRPSAPDKADAAFQTARPHGLAPVPQPAMLDAYRVRTNPKLHTGPPPSGVARISRIAIESISRADRPSVKAFHFAEDIFRLRVFGESGLRQAGQASA